MRIDYSFLDDITSRDERVGLLTMQASGSAEVMHRLCSDNLKCLFAAEHGFFGAAMAGETMSNGVHSEWGIPIYSLYGASRHPAPETLSGLDRIVIDLCDIGVRCYTYLATLRNMLFACADAHIPVTVIDRPIPLGGVVDGPVVKHGQSSFLAPIAVPLCHGMTPGECATWIVREEHLPLDLTVVRVAEWTHADRTPWPNFMPPSPAICSWDSAALYSVLVFTEAYPALDCDRGGSLSFRAFGAPFLSGTKFCDEMCQTLCRFGVSSRPYRYQPRGGAYVGQMLDGVLLGIDNVEDFRPVRAGATILASLLKMHGAEMSANARYDWLVKLYADESDAIGVVGGDLDAVFSRWDMNAKIHDASRVNLYK